MLPTAAAIALSYLTGSIPTALITGYLVGGVDIRALGSGNAGATNVYRVFGLKPYVAVLIVDVFKGYFAAAFIPVWTQSGFLDPLRLSIACGITAVLGHVFTIFARFRGGKGVATAAGVMLAVAPAPLLIAVAVYVCVTAVTHYVSVGSMSAALSVPATLAVSRLAFGKAYEPEVYAVSLLLAVLIIFTHRSNIARLLRGEETKTRFFKKT